MLDPAHNQGEGLNSSFQSALAKQVDLENKSFRVGTYPGNRKVVKNKM